MGTIYVYGPSESVQTGMLVPLHNGISRFWYAGQGQYCVPAGAHVDPWDVAKAIDYMQQWVPLGFIGDYHVFCLDQVLCSESPTGLPVDISNFYDGQRFNGWLALSGNLSRPMWKIFTHEMFHEVDKSFLNDEQRQELHAILGIPNYGNDLALPWHRRSEEIIADYLSCIVTDQPLHPALWQTYGLPSWDTALKVVDWVKRIYGGKPKAKIEVRSYVEVVMTEGSNVVRVNGETDQLIPGHPEVVAETRNDFFSFPGAFASRIIPGATKAWDDAKKQGTFKFPAH